MKAKYENLHYLMENVVGAVAEAGPHGGMPDGVLYSVLSSMGCTLQSYQILMGLLMSAGRVKKQGHLYFIPDPTLN